MSVDPVTEAPERSSRAHMELVARLTSPRVKRVYFIVLLAVGALYSVYPVSWFAIRPLDSSHTLRPVLYSLYSSFVGYFRDTNQAFAVWRLCSTVLLVIPPLLAVLNFSLRAGMIRPPAFVRKAAASKVLFFASISANLLVCRFPALLAGELNPDETQFLASALKLFKDPVFFRSVDCGTSGPMNVIPLMLPALFGISPDYASGRLVGMLIIFLSIFVMYKVFAQITEDSLARVAILPLAASFAVMTDANFLHYSSEHFPLLLTALAIYAATRVFLGPAAYAVPIAGLGVLLSAAWLAKWQAVPTILCITIVSLLWVHWRQRPAPFWRPSLMLVCGLAPLLLLTAIVCLSTGVLYDFWMSYVAGNLGYVSKSEITAANFIEFALNMPEIHWLAFSIFSVLAAYAVYLTQRSRATGLRLLVPMGVISAIAVPAADAMLHTSGIVILPYVGMLSLLSLGAAFWLLFEKRETSSPLPQWFGFLTGAVVIASGLAAYAPHRLYAHYLMFLIIPLTMAISWPLLKAAWERTVSVFDEPNPATSINSVAMLPLVAVFAVLIVAGQTMQQFTRDAASFSLPRTVHSAESEYIASMVPPGGEIVVWGWNARPYVGSGRVPATRDTNMANFFRDNPVVDTYYRERFLKDMKLHPPAMFVDSVKVSQGSLLGFETVPAIDAYIRSNYTLISSNYGMRFFVRRDAGRLFITP